MKSMNKLFCIIALLCLANTSWAQDKLNVLACEPEWAALAYELGGDRFNIHSATTFRQDAHFVQARPSLIAKARKADLIVCTGAELEIGWLPVLLSKSSNKQIQQNALGYFMATDYVNLLEKKSKVTRSMGDVHAAGNPHIIFDPNNIKKVAAALNTRLQKIDPTYAAQYQSNYNDFITRYDAAIAGWAKYQNALANKNIMAHHKSWIYLTEWANINTIATLEPKPGVPPSSGHLSKLLKQVKQNPPQLIILSSYQDPKAAKWMSKKTGVPYAIIPASVDQWNQKGALMKWFNDVLVALSENTKG